MHTDFFLIAVIIIYYIGLYIFLGTKNRHEVAKIHHVVQGGSKTDGFTQVSLKTAPVLLSVPLVTNFHSRFMLMPSSEFLTKPYQACYHTSSALLNHM